MRTITNFALIVGSLGSSLLACDAPYGGEPAIDPNAPRVHITSPERGTFIGDTKTVVVTGTVEDDGGPSAVESVEVNGVPAVLDGAGGFVATLTVEPGTQLLHAVAKDTSGNTGKETRAVVAGALTSLDRFIPSGITASLSAQTFEAVGRGTSGFIETADLTAMVKPMNPVVNTGAPDGPDCLYAQAFVTAVDVNTADIKLIPQPGGIYLDATITRPRVDMFMQYAVSCADGSRNGYATADRLRVRGLFAIGTGPAGFDIALREPQVTLDNLQVEVGGMPQEAIDMFDLDRRMGPILAAATERFVVPMLNKSLAGLNETKTLDLMGKKIDVTVAPARVEFDVTGGILEVDTQILAQGSEGAPGFVFIDNAIPQMNKADGFQIAVADDTANQMLTSFWAAKGMDLGIDLANGSYGEVGTLYDRVELSAKVPPFVDATTDKLQLTVGDLLVTFKNGESVATQVAVNAHVALSVGAGPDGALRLDVGQPTIYVDILDENIDGANALSTAQFEAITSFALSRIVAVGSGSVGAIPLPGAGGVAVQDLSIQQQKGYLVVDGAVR